MISLLTKDHMYRSNLAAFVKSSLVKSVEVCNKSAISAN